ncbi:MAG: hypothetical protein M0P31_13690 [Solirubrobacteraceae bacterium]|nr:hypothetical protein [Solirubrobacteraceae bacterium]
MTLVTEGRGQVTVVVDGTSLGVWDKVEGGHLTTDAEGYRPGGMAKRILKSGVPEEENVKVSRFFDSVRDLALHQWLKDAAKRNATMSVGKGILSPSGSPDGSVPAQSGHLIGVTEPEFDSTSNAEVRVELEMLVLS